MATTLRSVGVFAAAAATWAGGGGVESADGRGGAPEVSVIVPAYRRPDLLAEALGSVRRQTYADWECLVIDSGFADRSREVVEALGDARFRYETHHPPGLPATARNQGVSLARGRVLAFLDHDDAWHPRRLARGLERMRETGAEFVYAPLWNWSTGPDGRRATFAGLWASLREGPLVPDVLVDGPDAWAHLEHLVLPPSGVLMTRALCERAGGFPVGPESFGTDDYELWLRASALGVVAGDPRPAGWMRRHEGQATWGIDLAPRREAAASRFASWLDALPRRGSPA